jgi:hypothetical protein
MVQRGSVASLGRRGLLRIGHTAVYGVMKRREGKIEYFSPLEYEEKTVGMGSGSLRKSGQTKRSGKGQTAIQEVHEG